MVGEARDLGKWGGQEGALRGSCVEEGLSARRGFWESESGGAL